MYILGISAFYHDSAACILKEGNIVAAAQEERFTRKKHDPDFPQNAVQYCLREAGIGPDDIEAVVFYEKPFVKFDRLLETYLAFAPKGFPNFAKAMPLWIKEKLFQKSFLVECLNKTISGGVDWNERIHFSEHHLSHAASAFFPSPFERAAILTLDGVGEWTTSSLAIGEGNEMTVLKEIRFPHSLGLLYSAFTYYLGFKVNSGEYKVMGLAPYGEPRYADLIMEKLIHVADDGSFKLDMQYFEYATGLTMTNSKFDKLFGGPPRMPETDLSQRDMDLAASVQKVLEIVVLKMAKDIRRETGEKNLCLAGGVALNCVVNGILLRENIFDNIWVQPAGGDAGCAIGAALCLWHLQHGKARSVSGSSDGMSGAYLGPEFGDDEIEAEIRKFGATYRKLPEQDLIETVSEALADGKAVGWFQGRMEFGPRALGARSIIADPRLDSMQKQLNLKVKYRESFRPFAPSVLREEVANWFETEADSPYMTVVVDVKSDRLKPVGSDAANLKGLDLLQVPRSDIPAVTHVDNSARIQTVHQSTNPRYHALISRFHQKTECPILINTSFNVRGEPIVCSPIDALKCFMGTELDMLAIGNFVLVKEEQHGLSRENVRNSYEPD